MPESLTIIAGHEVAVVPGHQVEIPRTDPEHYITGIYALNVPSPDGTSGDWHDVFHWREGLDKPATVQLGGTGYLNTNHIFADLGIYEGKDRLTSIGLEVPAPIDKVYVANHFRAILDMLYGSLTKREAVYNLDGATDDWLDTDEQKEYLLTRAEMISPYLTRKAQAALASWIERERKGKYA